MIIDTFVLNGMCVATIFIKNSRLRTYKINKSWLPILRNLLPQAKEANKTWLNSTVNNFGSITERFYVN